MKRIGILISGIFGIIILIMFYFMIILKFDEFLNPADYLLILSYFSLLIGAVYIIFKILMNDRVSFNIDMFLGLIFLFALVSTFLLTSLLMKKFIPDYLNSIYILLGSVMVAVIGIYLDRKLNAEKEKKKIQRLNLIINSVISSNKKLAGDSVHILAKDKEKKGLKTLKTDFWDILKINILEVNLDSDMVQNLLSLKELSYDINDMIMDREDFLDGFNASNEDDIKKINEHNDKLTIKLKKLIKESDNHLKVM